jgi:hypothetical protein
MADTQTQGEVMEVATQEDPQPVKTLYAQLCPIELQLKNLGIKRYNYNFSGTLKDKVYGANQSFIIFMFDLFFCDFCPHCVFSKSANRSNSIFHVIVVYLTGIYEGEFLVGRSEQSNLELSSSMMPDLILHRVSKEQFLITKEPGDDMGPVYITDLSRNGTYLNGDLIGKRNKRILGNGDIISLVQGVYKGKHIKLQRQMWLLSQHIGYKA